MPLFTAGGPRRVGARQPIPILQDQGLVAVDALQAVPVAQLQAERFLFLEQGHGLLQRFLFLVLVLDF
jgi:hypothetical protein